MGLIEKGANVSLPNENGETPLAVAVCCSNEDTLKIVRLLLMNGSDPCDLTVEDDDLGEGVLDEINSFKVSPSRYVSDHSALIALSIGLASLDLPVLIVTIISEYLVSINQEKLFGQYSDQKNWKIASLIKKKAQSET